MDGAARSRARAVRTTTRSARGSPRTNPAAASKKGIGFATFMHGAGFTGSGEDHLASVVEVEATADGRVRVLAASTEIGQGTNTIFAQIAADALGSAARRRSRSRSPTPRVVPNSGPTVASRTVHGRRQAGRERRRSGSGARWSTRGLLGDAVHAADVPARRAGSYVAHAAGRSRRRAQYQPPPGVHWDDETYQGDAYGAYAWAVYVAEVTVDLDHLRDARRRLRRRAGSRHGDPPGARGRPDRRRRRAGDRLGALRGRRLARRPHGQRADDQLHHADVDGPAADPRLLRGAAVRARARRRQGHRRAADGRRRRRRSSTPSTHATGVDPTRAAADAGDR